jgi:hypothetical protein
VCSDGWTLLLTANSAPVSDPADRLLTLYHARTGRSVSFAAAGGCFRAGLPQVLVVSADENHITKQPIWCVTAIDLSDIHSYWEAEKVPVVPPGTAPAAATAIAWKDPISLRAAPTTLHSQWSLQLPNADKHAHDLQRDVVCTAALDLTSDPALPCLRVVSRHKGSVLDVSLKAFSKGLSLPGGVPEPLTEQEQVAGSPQQSAHHPLSCSLPVCPLHVWSIGKLVYVLTEGGELHQCGVGGVVPQYVGSSPIYLPRGARPPPPAAKALPEEPAIIAAEAASPVAVKPPVRGWTDNPGFKKLKSPAVSPGPKAASGSASFSPAHSPSASPTPVSAQAPSPVAHTKADSESSQRLRPW